MSALQTTDNSVVAQVHPMRHGADAMAGGVAVRGYRGTRRHTHAPVTTPGGVGRRRVAGTPHGGENGGDVDGGSGEGPPSTVATGREVASQGAGSGEPQPSQEPVAYREATGERSNQAEADFTAYVRQRRASLYATAYHLTGDRYEAEDLLQSALFSTYRAWGRIADKQALGGYLRRTMTNLHISAWRRRKINEYPTEEIPEKAADADAMRGTELRAVLWDALAKLPETQRTMLVLRYYDGRTDPEIADLLGIRVGTVKSSIWRALRRLRGDETLNFDGGHAFGELVA